LAGAARAAEPKSAVEEKKEIVTNEKWQKGKFYPH